ncbi:MAG: hypothetical protein VBE63_29910, partial [Lamprobacter sp.]|uniref:hypothetical protein n=1 Tax=Lamprobacter sp. TaxID=3100796 RepID=UPI002B257ADC
TARFSVKITGRDNRTYTDVSGTYPIIGPWSTAGFIVVSDSGPQSLCASSNCNLHASHPKILHGEPIETSSRPIQGAPLAASTIREALQPFEEVGEVYLVGTVLLQGLKANPPTLEVASDTVRLIYTRPERLELWAGKTLREVNLTAQVRHQTGAEIPEVPTLNASSATIPPLLQRRTLRHDPPHHPLASSAAAPSSPADLVGIRRRGHRHPLAHRRHRATLAAAHRRQRRLPSRQHLRRRRPHARQLQRPQAQGPSLLHRCPRDPATPLGHRKRRPLAPRHGRSRPSRRLSPLLRRSELPPGRGQHQSRRARHLVGVWRSPTAVGLAQAIGFALKRPALHLDPLRKACA